MSEDNNKTGIIIAFLIIAVIFLVIILTKTFSDEKQSNETFVNTENDIESTNRYSKNGISFVYPSNYKITGEEVDENGIFDLTCEIKGSDVSQIEITTFSADMFLNLSTDDVKFVCVNSMESVQEELQKNVFYKNSTFSEIKEGLLGKWTCYQKNFSASMLGVTVYGFIKEKIFDNGTMLIVTAIYENDNNKQTLEQIERSICLEQYE